MMVKRQSKTQEVEAETHSVHSLLNTNHQNTWEYFILEIQNETYQCWLHDRWGYQSLKVHLRKVLSAVSTREELVEQLSAFFSEYPSEYACILVGQTQSVAVVDHMRSVPLFYTLVRGDLFISDRPEKLFSQIDPVLVKSELRKFLLTGLVPGNRTLLKGVYQIQAGELIHWKNNTLHTCSYYHFWREEPQGFSFSNQIKNYRDRFLSVMEEFLKAYAGIEIILLLSGGMDSRYILWSLNELAPNNKNIHLCTYGRSHRRDVDWGRKVAEKSPFHWIFIPQNFTGWRKIYQSELIKNYFKRNHYFTNLSYYQEFYTLKYLTEKRILPGNCIFINGDSGGLLSGSHLSSISSAQSDTMEEFVSYLARNKFNLWSKADFSDDELDGIHQTIKYELAETPEYPRYLANIYDWWEWKEKTSKFLMTAKFQFNYFNHRLFHPFWDKRIVNFFENLPLSQRTGQKFYHAAYRKFVEELNPSLLTVPVTVPGKAKWRKKFRRGFEFISDPKWGRYSTENIANARSAARYLLHSASFNGLPSINAINAGVFLWNLIQKYPVIND